MLYDDGKIRVRASIPEDVASLSNRLRESDKNEVWASHHLTPEKALAISFINSSECYTIENGTVIAMFGVAQNPEVETQGTIWLLASDDLSKIKSKFIRNNKQIINKLLSKYCYLDNYVDDRNKQSIKWLKLCGANISEPMAYGPDDMLFRYFWFMNDKKVRIIDSLEIAKFSPRERMNILAKAMKDNGALEGDSDFCPLEHTFCDGSYVRKIFMPKGALVISKIHKKRHPYFIMSGDVSVVTENSVERIKAPYYGITEAGTRRALYVHEDTTWVTVHATEKTNLIEIENDIIAKSFDEIESLKMEAIQCHG